MLVLDISIDNLLSALYKASLSISKKIHQRITLYWHCYKKFIILYLYLNGSCHFHIVNVIVLIRRINVSTHSLQIGMK